MWRTDSLEKPWCWERSKTGREGDDRKWVGWMVLPTRRTWVWASSRSWWWTGKPGVLQSMGLRRVGHDWATELSLTELHLKWVQAGGAKSLWTQMPKHVLLPASIMCATGPVCGPGKILSVSQLGFLTCRMGLWVPLCHRVGVTMEKSAHETGLEWGQDTGHAKECLPIALPKIPNKIAERNHNRLEVHFWWPQSQVFTIEMITYEIFHLFTTWIFNTWVTTALLFIYFYWSTT